MDKEPQKSGYRPIGWQNFNRRLTREEFDEIGSRISGLHFSKETFDNDPLVLLALHAAEALYREVVILSKRNPFPTED